MNKTTGVPRLQQCCKAVIKNPTMLVLINLTGTDGCLGIGILETVGMTQSPENLKSGSV